MRGLMPSLLRSAGVLVLALALSPMIRGITADLTNSVGRTWPFAMEHCRTAETPGCTPPNHHLAMR